jgi:hypothetical protein
MSENTRPDGFRNDLMFVRAISEVLEKNHSIASRPSISLGGSQYSSGNVPPMASWWLSADYPDSYWKMPAEELAIFQREDLERRIAAILDGFGEGVEWEKNDPTKDEYAYVLTADYAGGRVRISTSRESVCEKVVVLETEREEEQPDPEWLEKVTSAAPKVKVTVKDTITEWQCNQALAEKTAPMHARTITKSDVSV